MCKLLVLNIPQIRFGAVLEAAGTLRLLCAAFVLGALWIVPAHADTFTFNDLTETVTFSHVGTDTTVRSGSNGSNCNGGEPTTIISNATCILFLNRGTQNSSSSFRVSFAEDPSLLVLSDTAFGFFSNDDAAFDVVFRSFADGASLSCASRLIGGCTMQETGLPQLVGTITWSGGGSTDQIFIQSDAEPVPEPSSLLILTAALGMLGLGKRLKL